MAASHRQLNAPPQPHLAAPCFEPRLARSIISSYAILWAGTLLFALVALPFAEQLRGVFAFRFALAPAGTASMAALILASNVREAMIPFLFAVLKIRGTRLAIVGDVVVGISLAINVMLGGLAVGSYGLRLLPYLPQWPLEWGGLAIGLAVWRRARRGRRDPLELVFLAIAVAILLCLAALLETYAVPQG